MAPSVIRHQTLEYNVLSFWWSPQLSTIKKPIAKRSLTVLYQHFTKILNKPLPPSTITVGDASSTVFSRAPSLSEITVVAARRTISTSLTMQLHRVTAVFLSMCFGIVLRWAQGLPHHDAIDRHWYPGSATWYGEPEGDGSTGGACGYGTMVDVKPLRARVGAVGPFLFKGGEGCGACYKVKCLDKSVCSTRAVTVIITDECPGCPSDRTHFDLSGAVFGRMAVAGENGQLRNRGEISVIYRRTPCTYPGYNVAFHVNEGSTPFWLSLLVEFEDGDGDIGSMHIKEAGSNEWVEMKHVWGASWCITRGPLKGPFSVKLSTSTGKSLTARDVIPRNWSPKSTYTSRLNFFP